MRNRRFCPHLTWLLILVGLLLTAQRCKAGVIYVDSRKGSDVFDGSSSEPVNVASGPVKTIRRALQLVRSAGTIVLAKNQTPYYESIQLTGSRHSGVGNARFTIVGNGAVIDGARPVPPAAWKRVGSDLWKMTPWRKGHFQLLLDGKPVSEHPCPRDAKSLPVISVGSWCAWRGSLYYQAAMFEEAHRLPFWFAFEGVGLSMYRVHDVNILDVTFRHFRIDGINAHSGCRNVVLENVTTHGNGRAGLFVGGTSDVLVRNCRVNGNRRYQVLISGLGRVELDQTELTEPPTFLD